MLILQMDQPPHLAVQDADLARHADEAAYLLFEVRHDLIGREVGQPPSWCPALAGVAWGFSPIDLGQAPTTMCLRPARNFSASFSK